MTFSGTQDTDDSSLLALSGNGTASGIGVAILDKDRNRITPGIASAIYPLDTQSSTASLVFYGQYVTTGANVTAGNASTDANFILSYE